MADATTSTPFEAPVCGRIQIVRNDEWISAKVPVTLEGETRVVSVVAETLWWRSARHTLSVLEAPKGVLKGWRTPSALAKKRGELLNARAEDLLALKWAGRPVGDDLLPVIEAAEEAADEGEDVDA